MIVYEERSRRLVKFRLNLSEFFSYFYSVTPRFLTFRFQCMFPRATRYSNIRWSWVCKLTYCWRWSILGCFWLWRYTAWRWRSWQYVNLHFNNPEQPPIISLEKRYTFIVKDKLLPMNPENGREQFTISYEYDFSISSKMVNSNGTFIFIPWRDFKATHRGKEKKEASALDRKKIKRFSTMMRRYLIWKNHPESSTHLLFSFFGDQEGSFPLPLGP